MGPNTFRLYTEESGDPDAVAKLVQQFLGRFRPSQFWSMTFAYTSSSPGVGDFGGGAVFVTAGGIKAVDTDYIADQQQKAFFSRTARNTSNDARDEDEAGND